MISDRRSGRIAKEIRIVLMGTDTAGRIFSEETHTVVLSRHGAGILSRHRLAPDETLTMRFLGGTAEASIRLVGELGQDTRGHTYGVAFLDPDIDFWELKFPPPPQWQGGISIALECGSCQAQDTVDQTEVEADVYALAGHILRFCSGCGTATEWHRATAHALRPVVHAAPHTPAPSPAPPKMASPLTAAAPEKPMTTHHEPIEQVVQREAGGAYSSVPPVLTDATASSVRATPVRVTPVQVAAQEAASHEPPPPAATAVVARTANRRRDVRTRVSFTACIRQVGATDEEIVECDNISRGGFSFRSRKAYAEDSAIEVAVPYSPGGHAIFVVAAIRRVETIASGNLFRYGAAYSRKNAAIRNCSADSNPR